MMAARLPTISTLTQAEIWAETLKHRGLIGLIAKRYRGRGLDVRELVTEGLFGVFRAVELYDPTLTNPASGKPYAFTTYATRWIHQAIHHAIEDKAATIRIPRNDRRPFASDAVLSPVRSLDVMRALVAGFAEPAATEVPTGLDDDQVEQLRLGIAALTPRQTQVLSAIFLDGERPTDLAARLGLTKQCVGMHRRHGLDRLREMFATTSPERQLR